MKNMIGKTIYNRDRTNVGVIKGLSYRYCAACGKNHMCLLVKWNDGKTTKPCSKGIAYIDDGNLIII